MEHIGLKIKSLRKKKDLTQEKLAEYLGVSFQAVSKWETGVASPDLSMIIPLARLLGCSTDELFGLVDSAADPRKNELRTLYMATQQTGDLKTRYDIATTAVKHRLYRNYNVFNHTMYWIWNLLKNKRWAWFNSVRETEKYCAAIKWFEDNEIQSEDVALSERSTNDKQT